MKIRDPARLLIVVLVILATSAGCDLLFPVQGPAPTGAGPDGPVVGQVLGPDGQPAANVTINAFPRGQSPLVANSGGSLVGNTGGSLVGNTGGALVGNTGGSLAAFRRIQAGTSVTTDAGGRFALTPPAAGLYNLEAVQSNDSKAWKASVNFGGAGTRADVGAMNLAPVGHIAGKVRALDAHVTDFTATQVYVPGSSYVAVTDDKGNYRISNVPAGAFDLGAFNVNLGDARLGTSQSPDPVRVASDQTTTAPDLVLAARIPELARMTRAESQVETDNGAVGTVVDLHGKYFGFNRGIPVRVTFNGVPAESPDVRSEELIRVKVPSGATNGKVAVSAGNLTSNQLAFRILKTLTMACDGRVMVLGETVALADLYQAQDTENIAIREVIEGSATLRAPNVAAAVDSNRSVIHDDGRLEALSVGGVVLTLRAGDLTRTCTFEVAGTRPTPAPTLGPPALSSLTPDNGGPGATVVLSGESFGAATESFVLTFGGVPASAPTYVDGATLRAEVPVGAISGLVILKVNDRAAPGVPFKVLRSLSLQPSSVELLVGRTQAFEVGAADTAGQTVANPAVTWTSSGASVTVDSATGIATAVAPGDAVVAVASGVITQSASVHVYALTGLTVAPDTLTLNAMPGSGDPAAGFETTATLAATLTSSDGRSRTLTWASRDTTRVVILATAGTTATVQTARGAPEGAAEVVVAAADDPAVTATCSIAVTADGGIDLVVD